MRAVGRCTPIRRGVLSGHEDISHVSIKGKLMAGRGATTFQKRQKEQNRKEKREEKLARRQQRKLNPNPEGAGSDSIDAVVPEDQPTEEATPAS